MFWDLRYFLKELLWRISIRFWQELYIFHKLHSYGTFLKWTIQIRIFITRGFSDGKEHALWMFRPQITDIIIRWVYPHNTGRKQTLLCKHDDNLYKVQQKLITFLHASIYNAPFCWIFFSIDTKEIAESRGTKEQYTCICMYAQKKFIMQSQDVPQHHM